MTNYDNTYSTQSSYPAGTDHSVTDPALRANHPSPTTKSGSIGDKIRSAHPPSPHPHALTPARRGAISSANRPFDNLRTNILDAADALTGTGKYTQSTRPTWSSSPAITTTPTAPALPPRHAGPQLPSEHAGAASIATTSGPSAGYGAGANPMRAQDPALEPMRVEERGVMGGEAPVGAEERAPHAGYPGNSPAEVDSGVVGTEHLGTQRVPGGSAL